MPAISLRSVSKRFGSVTALDAMTFTVERGTFFGFLGPNGAGKTTTLRTILGLLRRDQGDVSVLGLDPAVDGAEIRSRTGVLLESDGLYDRLSGENNLDYHARIHRLDAATRRVRIDELLRTFGLWERRRDAVSTWSTGMRQKLAIARALLHRPELLLLDEPFAGLDPGAAVELREALVALVQRERTTLFLTSHDLAHVEKACSNIAVIRAGRAIASGTLPELLTTRDAIEVDIAGDGLSGDILASMQRDELLMSYTMNGASARITCRADSRKQLGTELMKRGVIIEELRTHRGNLEETFLELVRE